MYSKRQRSKAIEVEKHSNNKQMTKDCFERFGDDLTEFVLSFLTIYDKIMFETVSTQWKSLLFNRQRKLVINPYITRSDPNNDLMRKLFNNESQVKLKAIKGLIKKFPFIIEIHFTFRINSTILNIITNNCKHLQKLTISNDGIDYCTEKSVKRFAEKLGQKLKIIRLSHRIYDTKNQQKLIIIYGFSPNIESIYEIKLSMITSKPNNYYSKLKKIYISSHWFTVREFTEFTDFYYKQINGIYLRSDLDKMFDKRLFNQLSRFENINVLSLEFNDNDLSINDIEEGFSIIGNNCIKLEKIMIIVWMKENSKLISINKTLFRIINSFQSITACEISICETYCLQRAEQFDTIDINNESLICMKNIKHLKLDIENLSDNYFKHLNQFMPNLKTIDITSNYNNCLITDKTLYILAKIEGLTDIAIHNYGVRSESINKITDEGVIDIIEKCKQIKSIIIIDFKSIITPKTIDAVLGLKLKPKTRYYFHFDDNIDGELREYIKSIEKDLSKNIKIEVY